MSAAHLAGSPASDCREGDFAELLTMLKPVVWEGLPLPSRELEDGATGVGQGGACGTSRPANAMFILGFIS